MVQIRAATTQDLDGLRRIGDRLDPSELAAVVGRDRVLVAQDGSEAVGLLRWGLFWDELPFMNLLVVAEAHRRRGVGRTLVEGWEQRMRARGHAAVLTSTLSDETAQHLYRRLGFVDCGGLLLPGEALEILFRKEL